MSGGPPDDPIPPVECKPCCTKTNEGRFPDSARVERQRIQAEAFFQAPVSGSFPFQISWDDVKRVGLNIAYVAASAAVTYALGTVLPGIRTENALGILALTIVTGALQAADAWLRDTRPAFEKQRLPYKVYKQTMRALKLEEARGVVVDPHLPKK